MKKTLFTASCALIALSGLGAAATYQWTGQRGRFLLDGRGQLDGGRRASYDSRRRKQHRHQQ